MARTLSERMRAHEQQKAKLAEVEARLKLDERKQRTRRLIELDTNALYGALLSLRDGADDKAQLEKWTALGGRTFDREAKARDEGKEPVLLTFTAPLPKDTTTALRKGGFRYSKVMQHWEGLARFDEASTLAKAHGGTARRVGSTAGLQGGSKTAEAAE